MHDTIKNRNPTNNTLTKDAFHKDCYDDKGHMKRNLVGLKPKMKKVQVKKRKTFDIKEKRQETNVTDRSPHSEERKAGSAMELKMD